ncbi:MAG TPA: hypothetical protein VM182_14115, partial [Terriglobia bacterium]|nr:hypothetical protein [Terriglobia bacterium]
MRDHSTRRFAVCLIASMAILSNLVVVAFEGPATARTVRVFVLSGQSNAVGYNNVKEYKRGKSELSEAFRNQPDILFWDARKSSWRTLRIGESEGSNPNAFG